MVTGKITRETYWQEDVPKQTQINLVNALEVEPGQREVEQYKAIEPFVRSLKMFKPYAEFESADFYSILQEMKLHKVRKGTRIFN